MLTKDEYKETYDLNGDGNITSAEIRKVKEMIEATNRDEKADSQKSMVWVGVVGMIIYPIVILFAAHKGWNGAVSALGDMASTYFVAVAGYVSAFFASEAYKKGKR